ncbi:MAG: TetR family transcriptional regulator [Kangiella sp.]|nr:MAG: TetR family transcriptional regulator [Kangiella sp.]
MKTKQASNEDFQSDESKPYHHGDLQQKLICAARELLEQNNVASLSLRAVAKKVGVSHSAPYRHFKDKESLLAGIAAVGFNELASKMLEAVSMYPDDPVAQLQEAGYEYMKLAMKNPQCMQLMFGNILPCHEAYPELQSSGEFAFNGLKIIIEAGQSKGVFKAGNVELLALTAWSTIHGLSILFISGQIEETISLSVDIKELAFSVSEIMLNGIKSN